MKKLLAMLLAALMLLTGCASGESGDGEDQAAGGAGDLETIDVVLDWYPNAVHAFLYEAEEKGYFAEEGLDVNILFPSNTSDPLTMTAAGRADIGFYYQEDTIIAKANAKGVKLGCFADTVEGGKKWRDLGVKFIGYACDTYIFMQAAKAELESRNKKASLMLDSDREEHFGKFLGESAGMQAVKHLAYKASRTRFNVILLGESGTGKSRLAREIHNIQNPNAPFVEVACNSIAPSLFESELFGYSDGAFTGASFICTGHCDSRLLGAVLCAGRLCCRGIRRLWAEGHPPAQPFAALARITARSS